MKLQIQEAKIQIMKVCLQIYSFYQYIQEVFVFLFTTFPYNIIAASCIVIFFIRFFKGRKQAINATIQLSKFNFPNQFSKTKIIQSIKLQMENEVAKLKVDIQRGQKRNSDNDLIRQLQRQEVELFQEYLSSTSNLQTTMDQSLQSMIVQTSNILNQQQQIEQDTVHKNIKTKTQ